MSRQSDPELRLHAVLASPHWSPDWPASVTRSVFGLAEAGIHGSGRVRILGPSHIRYRCHMGEVASRELRNDTRGVLKPVSTWSSPWMGALSRSLLLCRDDHAGCRRTSLFEDLLTSRPIVVPQSARAPDAPSASSQSVRALSKDRVVQMPARLVRAEQLPRVADAAHALPSTLAYTAELEACRANCFCHRQ